MRTAAGRRVFTYLRGRGAERLALVWRLAKGYRPLARRFSAAGGEIDLIDIVPRTAGHQIGAETAIERVVARSARLPVRSSSIG